MPRLRHRTSDRVLWLGIAHEEVAADVPQGTLERHHRLQPELTGGGAGLGVPTGGAHKLARIIAVQRHHLRTASRSRCKTTAAGNCCCSR